MQYSAANQSLLFWYYRTLTKDFAQFDLKICSKYTQRLNLYNNLYIINFYSGRI